jgi:hypothetical protein
MALILFTLNATVSNCLEVTLVEVDPRLQKFLEQRGEFMTSNGVKIVPSSLRLELGAAEGTTGYPRYIKGLNRGLAVGNRSNIFFNNVEQRRQYIYGLRMAIVEIVYNFKRAEGMLNISLPYVVILS